ncbi:YciI family protein [Conexibacter stalactiti]|uniref:YciI family protein n=1 Tax=Conexibacter stalactiti TaxID=1940611 RepID=A0ABU4HQF2_9ACTN|nr:YciI family protein [Conexibacter stalactiti]MDW5594785.1 YciI family protein [Conexibacter stalactiti]MEC5035427.1 YciI family protein [Conexibacter stalactiti]
MPETVQLLIYDYVPDILERRGPHRDGHLALIARLHEAGTMLMAGAAGDPVDKGVFVLRDTDAVEAFIAEDPYVAAGLVAGHRAEPWLVVTPL